MANIQFQINRLADGKPQAVQTVETKEVADAVRKSLDLINEDGQKHFVSPVLISGGGVGLKIPKVMTKTAGAR